MSVLTNLRRCIANARHSVFDVPMTRRAPIVAAVSRTTSSRVVGSDQYPIATVLAKIPENEGYDTMLCGQRRGFHHSTTRMLPVRRRRKGTGRKIESRVEESSEETDGSTTLQRMHAPVTDPLEFGEASTRLLDKIERAMEPMKANNEIFITKRSDGEVGEMYTIDLGPKVGFYQIEISLDERVFEYSSPISGKLLYCLSSTTNEWVNMDDGHQFEGILVRDLLRSNCIGLPDL